MKALTGPADQRRHESQWQYPMATGLPVTANSTAPQKQRPVWLVSALIVDPLRDGAGTPRGYVTAALGILRRRSSHHGSRASAIDPGMRVPDWRTIQR